MTRLKLTQTSFTSGELDPALAGRIDIRAWEEGAAKLRNVLVQRSGGVTRRPGSRRICPLPGARRLVSFDTPDGFDLLVLAPFLLSVVRDETVAQSGIAIPWSEEQIEQLTWTRVDQAVLFCHPDVEPQLVERDAIGVWSVRAWNFDRGDPSLAIPPVLQPYARLAPSTITLQAQDPDGNRPDTDPVPENVSIDLVSSAELFEFAHLGAIFRLHGKEVRITNVFAPTLAQAVVLQELPDGRATHLWDEQMFGDARGWPVAVTQHQDRLVLAGGRGAPDYLWLSRTGRPFDFDLGQGLDDQAIAFRLRSDELHRIRQVVSGRRLQVLTSQGEWVVSGSPLTPANIQVDQQTGVGSPLDRQVAALEIDGVTLFVGGSARDLREFLYTDTEQAFQAPDIALLSRHLMQDPRDMAFDADRRVLLIPRGDGAMIAVTIDRNSNIVAWTLQETAGEFIAATEHERSLVTLVARAGNVMLEAWDDTLGLDGCIVQSSASPTSSWSGLDDLVGQEVTVIADGAQLFTVTLTEPTLDLGQDATTLVVGLPFDHQIEALPIARRSGASASPDPLYRPVRLTLRLLETEHLEVDAGRGPENPISVQTLGEPHTGDVRMRAYGWRRGHNAAPWKISQRAPSAFTLLSVTSEIKVND